MLREGNLRLPANRTIALTSPRPKKGFPEIAVRGSLGLVRGNPGSLLQSQTSDRQQVSKL